MRAITLIAAESDGWGPGHVCGLLSTPAPPTGEVGPLQRVCPHTPQRQVFRKLPTQPCQNCPHAMRQAHTHAGLPCPPVSPPPEQLARPLGGPRVGRGSAGPGCPATLGPPASPACVSPVVDVWGALLVEDGQALVSQRIWRDKASQCFAGCLALESRVVNMLFMAPS